jgi:cysteine synthase B
MEGSVLTIQAREQDMMLRRFAPYFEKFPTLRLIGNTPLVEIQLFKDELPDVEIWAKCEWMNPGGSLKDRPVMYMLLGALESGELHPGKTILDSSSGNAGIAYALIGSILGYPVDLVVPGNASEERKKRITAHGARLIFTDPLKGYDEALREVHRLHQANRDRYYMADQYKNPNNWRAHYETTAVEILEQVPGPITHFVAGVGTGGTITGVGRRLKEHDPSIQVAALVPERFPGIEGLKPMGEPGDIVPEIYDDSVVDLKVEVRSEDAAEICRRLARQGLFVGPSSGGYLKVAYEVAKEIRRGRIVTVLNDIGERYLSTGLWG